MSDALLRRYEPGECGADGYPYAWHRRTLPDISGWGTYYEDDTSQAWTGAVQIREPQPAIKGYVRERADYRCLRCGHPYEAGDDRISERGQWSPCDSRCTHGLPLRVRRPDGSESSLRHETRFSVERPAGRLFDVCSPHGHIVEAEWRILTVHHLDEDKANCLWWNLAALCQRCHLRMQRAVVMGRPYHFEHSDWFKPYAAGFYAMKYLGENLSREETMARLDELLALEHRFNQDTLFD